LAEEEKECKYSHDMHIHAVDLHYPEARCMRVLYASCLVILKNNISIHQGVMQKTFISSLPLPTIVSIHQGIMQKTFISSLPLPTTAKNIYFKFACPHW
jgi:hypothetical protein